MGDRATFITSNEVVSERLAEIDSIADAYKKVEALVELTARLLPSPSEVRTQALSAANAIQDESIRSKILIAITSQLPSTERFNVLKQALSAASAIQDEKSRSNALAVIAPQLPETELQLLEQVLTAAKEVQGEEYCANALAAIVPYLLPTESQLLEQALTVAKSFQDEYYRLPEGDRYLQREFDKLSHDALQTEILPRTLTLEEMTHEIFNLIRSFSFVGEISEDPEDYRISETVVDDQSAATSKPIASENI